MSLGWTLCASASAIWLGFDRHSLVLVAFGAIGLLDAVGSLTLVIHFRHALRHEAVSERHEQIALRVVTVGMVVVGLVTAAQGVHRLTEHAEADAVPAGVVLAGLSAVVLALLATRKQRLGRSIPSAALRADGWVSAVGAMLAVVTVVGTGLTGAFGWWWVDPVAAIGIAFGAVATGIVLARRG